jgi:phage shock protein C
MERKLYRSRKNRLFLGVCGGLGEYYRIDPVLVRVIAVLVTVASGFFPGFVAYFILALIIPLEGTTAGTPQELFRENISDLENSSKHIGKQFKKNPARGVPLAPEPPPSPEPPPREPGISFPPPTRSNRGIYIIAILLVSIGIFIFILQSIPRLWSFLWPLTLVIAGAIIIVLVYTRKKSS